MDDEDLDSLSTEELQRRLAQVDRELGALGMTVEGGVTGASREEDDAPSSDGPGTGDHGINKMVDTFTMGALPHVAGGVNAAADWAQGKIGPGMISDAIQAGQTVMSGPAIAENYEGSGYEGYKEASRAMLDKGAEEHPWQDLGGTVLGIGGQMAAGGTAARALDGATGVAGALGRAANGAGAIARTGSSAATNAAISGTEGLIRSDGDLGVARDAAAQGFGLGALTTGGMSVARMGLGKAGRLAQKIPGMEPPRPPTAYRVGESVAPSPAIPPPGRAPSPTTGGQRPPGRQGFRPTLETDKVAAWLDDLPENPAPRPTPEMEAMFAEGPQSGGLGDRAMDLAKEAGNELTTGLPMFRWLSGAGMGSAMEAGAKKMAARRAGGMGKWAVDRAAHADDGLAARKPGFISPFARYNTHNQLVGVEQDTNKKRLEDPIARVRQSAMRASNLSPELARKLAPILQTEDRHRTAALMQDLQTDPKLSPQVRKLFQKGK